jgi:hypothetical protein
MDVCQQIFYKVPQRKFRDLLEFLAFVLQKYIGTATVIFTALAVGKD